jgi:pimeloyl-ACP methyl ester carboxylesterase
MPGMADPSEQARPLESFEREGLRFDVIDRGPSAGEPVVLLHGFPQDATAWQGVTTRLTAAGYRTLAPDQRGYSPAARPRSVDAYRDRALVDDVWALLDAAGLGQVHLVGHDWGAYVAWSAAADRPDRVHTLCALSVPHPYAIRTALRSGKAMRSWYMAVMMVPGLAEVLLRPGSSRFAWLLGGLPPEQVEHYVARMSEPGAFTAALNWYRALPHSLRHAEVHVGRIVRPTLFVWGSSDPSISRAAAAATAASVGAPFTETVLDKAGHWLPETREAQVSDLLLQHLSRHPLTP